jgi:hypothetical protein
MFQIKGPQVGMASTECMTEDDFVGLVSKSMISNVDSISDMASTNASAMSK